MKIQLTVAERPRTAEVHRHAGGYHVTLDGHVHQVDAVRVNEHTWSLLVRGADGVLRSVEAVVVPQNGNGAYEVYIDGHRIPVTRPRAFGGRARDGAAGAAGGPQRIVAPMPGKIVRVLVRPGDEVKPRQGLVVVEAMKMENELRASRDGRVREVFVSEGQSVEAGTALVVVE